MYLFIYKLEFYDTDEENRTHASGCTFANTYMNAIDNIIKYYGGDEVIFDIQLTSLGSSNNILEFYNQDEVEYILSQYAF